MGGVLVKNLKIREGEMQRAKQMEGRLVMCLGNAPLGLGLEKAIYLYLFFFLSVGLDEPVRFSSVQSVSDFQNRNQTELDFFCDF